MAEIKRDGFIEGAKKGDRFIRFNKSVPFRSSVIVQVSAGSQRHFLIVDGVKSVGGVNYYMTRDSLAGPRGVQQGILDGAMSYGVNAIVIGK